MINVREFFPAAKAAAGMLHGSRAFGGPLQANLNITNRCNLRCKHCFIYSPLLERTELRAARAERLLGNEIAGEDLHRRKLADADPQWLKTVIDGFCAMGTRRFQLSGNGELLVHPAVLDLLQHVKDRHAYAVINSNGTLLDEEKIDRMLAMRVDELRITVMAGTSDLYNLLHPGCPPETFNSLTEQMKLLQHRKRERGVAVPRLTLVCVVVGDNCSALAEFARYACRLDADAVLFKSFDTFGQATLSSLVPRPAEHHAALRSLGEARLILGPRGITHNVERFLTTFGPQLETSAIYATTPCYYGWLAAFVDLDGMVYFCCRCDRPLGNAREQSIEAIWYGAPYAEMRRKAKMLPAAGMGSIPCSCHTCPHSFANRKVQAVLHPWAASDSPAQMPARTERRTEPWAG